jgi:hypothetical protein
MPFSMRFETDLVIATCSGALRLDDAREGAAAVWEKPEWSGKPVVWDFRTAHLNVRAPEVREIARFILERQPAIPPSRVAFVTASDADFGLVRMFQVLRQHPSTAVRVFREFEEAVSWARSIETNPA